jgi:hypothetical protein
MHGCFFAARLVVLFVIVQSALVVSVSADTPVCTACGKPLTGEAVIYNGDTEHPYCLECDASPERCDACGQPLGVSWRLYSDGRRLCALCLRDGVFSAERAMPIKREVFHLLESLVGIRPPNDVHYQIVDEKRLRVLLGREVGYEQGLTDLDTTGAITISILSGLRSVRFTHTLAHEIAHAWAFENTPSELSLETSEGFAEWIAFLVLEKKGYNNETSRMISRGDVYGEGLRRMLSMQQRWGVAGILSRLKSGSLR